MNVFYFGEIDFCENNSAAVVRVLNNCRSIRKSGLFNVQIIGKGNFKYINIDGFNVLSLKKGKSLLSKLLYYGCRSLQLIRTLSTSRKKIDIVVYYGASSRILLPLLIFCRLYKIKLIADVVEWYDYSHLPLGRYGPFALDVHLVMTKLIPACDGAITISQFLENYYRNRNVFLLRIPILINVEEEPEFKPHEPSTVGTRPIHLICAGHFGKKESLANLLHAVNEANADSINIYLHIIGITLNEFKSKFGTQKTNYIIIYGKLPRSKVKEHLSKADFSVLFRPNKRFANAGFPTKFVESLSVGLPVLANITSDLHMYLQDGYNGFVAKDDSVKSIAEVLHKVIILEPSQISTMKINAKISAKEYFDYKKYSDEFDEFFSKISQISK